MISPKQLHSRGTEKEHGRKCTGLLATTIKITSTRDQNDQDFFNADGKVKPASSHQAFLPEVLCYVYKAVFIQPPFWLGSKLPNNLCRTRFPGENVSILQGQLKIQNIEAS